MIAQLVADSGLPRMMIREIAKDPECVGKITGASAGLIWAISLVVCLVVAVIAIFLPFGNDMKIAVVIMTLATLATFHGAGYSAVLRAFEDNELNYLGFILQKILLLVFILVMLHFRTGMVGFVCAHLLSNFCSGPSITSSFPGFIPKSNCGLICLFGRSFSFPPCRWAAASCFGNSPCRSISLFWD